MQKVFILLRNNQQTGPFSLEEIIQFDLKPYDLIWIEGKSAGWYYPQEIRVLHPHLSFIKHSPQPDVESTSQTAPVSASETVKPKKVFVAMPATSVQEEVIQKPSAAFASARSESYKPTELPRQAEPELKTTYAKSLEEVETEYMKWTHQKKKKKGPAVSKKGVMAACLLVSIAFAGWWAVKSFSGSANDTPEQFALTPVQDEIPLDSASETNTEQTGIKASVKKEKQIKLAATKEVTTLPKKDATKKANNEVALNDNPTVNNDYEEPTPGREEAKVPVDDKKPEPITEATKEKKKKLGEKFLDLLKKKPEEEKNEEVKPAENENGERRSARRETNLATQVNIKFEVPNDWMMGIKGAKASLTNRSTETVVKATVEVQYYNEDNELLQTKTVIFSNIGPKKTANVFIPDHSFADHLDYKVISVQAAEPLAKM
jgi:hypothetical protein